MTGGGLPDGCSILGTDLGGGCNYCAGCAVVLCDQILQVREDKVDVRSAAIRGVRF